MKVKSKKSPTPIRGVTAPTPGRMLLKPSEAAYVLNISAPLLRVWRRQGVGPRWVRLGAKSIRYPIAGIDTFMATLGMREDGVYSAKVAVTGTNTNPDPV